MSVKQLFYLMTIIVVTGLFISISTLYNQGVKKDVEIARLELSSYGNTEKDAKKNFETEVAIFIQETEARGTLEKLLLRLGWCLKGLPDPKYLPLTI